MDSEIQRCYRALELEPGASLEQIKQSWRELVKVWHPDRFPNDPKLQNKAQERLKEINNAYEILQVFLASGSAPSRSRPTAPQSSGSNQGKTSQQSKTESERAETPTPKPPKSDQQAAGASNESKPGLIFAIVVVVVILLIIIARSGSDSSSTLGTGSPNYGSKSGGSGTGFVPAPAYTPPISKSLDEKNGFKEFRFGMTPEEVQAILPPSEIRYQPGPNVTNFQYRATTANLIGDLAVDYVGLSFFEGHLYRIDLRFSNSQNEILEAFKVNFGEPFDTDTWTRGDQPLHAKAWRGKNVSAVILSLPDQLWDSAVIYNNEASSKAQDYAAKEPERAAKDFGTNGFKSLVMGMDIKELTREYKVNRDDQVTGVKKIYFEQNESWKDWQAVGYYPVTSISAEFFHDKLYRIDLAFNENQKEIFEAFKQRFGQLQDDNTWTRGDSKLKAKSSVNDKQFAAILAPQISYGGETNWDAIVLLDVPLLKDAEQFKTDAPKRAAKDF